MVPSLLALHWSSLALNMTVEYNWNMVASKNIWFSTFYQIWNHFETRLQQKTKEISMHFFYFTEVDNRWSPIIYMLLFWRNISSKEAPTKRQ